MALKTVDYVSKTISVHIPVKGLYDELKMACVGYSILGIDGKEDAQAFMKLLEIIIEDEEAEL